MKDRSNAFAIAGMSLSTLLNLFFIYGEVAGVYHAFSKHGVGDGIYSVIIPPFAWYRSVELFFHTDSESQKSIEKNLPKSKENESNHTESLSDNKTLEPQFEMPLLTDEEKSQVAPIVFKAAAEPLSTQELRDYSNTWKHYVKRVDHILPDEDIEKFVSVTRISNEYNCELGDCLLKSFNSRKLILTDKFIQTAKKMMENQLMDEEKFSSDKMLLNSEATGEEYKNNLGALCRPLGEDEIKKKLSNFYKAKANYGKLVVAMHEANLP